MTDTEKNIQMETLDEINCIGSLSNTKESDTENVDAIKKFIEEQEQEILLRKSSPDHDLEPRIENHSQVVDTKNVNELVQQQLDPDDFAITTIKHQKQQQSTSLVKITADIEEQDASKEKNEITEANIEFLQRHQTPVTNINTQQVQQSPELLQANIQLQDVEPAKGIAPRSKHENSTNTAEETKVQSDLSHDESKTPKETENSYLDNTVINKSTLHTLNSLENLNQSKWQETALVSGYDTKTEMVSGIPERPKLLHQLLTSDTLNKEKQNLDQFKCENLNLIKAHNEETLAIATSVMDMILTNTEATLNKKKVDSVLAKQCAEQASSSVSLKIGSKVEAKDFSELWYPAQIVEVDCEEMEVLVQYDDQPKKHNEWISINSPRLRPISSTASKPMLPASPVVNPTESNVPEPKVEDKQKLTFAVGERCLARWRDNRRFIATIHNDLGNGHYEVMFDDGFQWKCPQTRLHKLKETSKHDYPCFKSSLWSSPAPAPSPAGGAPGPAPAAPAEPAAPAAPPAQSLARIPLFHTHLFDPTRDYLGSKSERREMKRKLNIKEIFNIGQKRKKPATGEKEAKSIPICNNSSEDVKPEIINRACTPEATPLKVNSSIENNSFKELKNSITKKKDHIRKKPFMRKKIKLKSKTKKEVPCLNDNKKEIPDAVAAIIGTVIKNESLIDEIKTDSNAIETKDSNANDIKLEEPTPDEITMATDANTTLEKQDTETVPESDKTNENFDIQDDVKHEEVMDKIKEVITKLEDGINEVEKNEMKPAATLEVVANEAPPTLPAHDVVSKEKRKKSKVKKSKKLRLMQDKKEKKHVDRVKYQLEEMKKQVEEMRKQIMLKTEELASSRRGEGGEADAASLLPGEWCCRWVDGQPAGAVSELRPDARPGAPQGKPPLPRRSVQVEDNRLPPGWTKHMVRRSVGNSAGKWDVVLVSPDNRRLHTKSDMRLYLENSGDASVRGHEAALLDFGIHLKLARRLGWVRSSADGAPPPPPPQPALAASSPLVKRRKLARPPRDDKLHKRRRELKIKIPRLVMNSSSVNISKENDVVPEPHVEEEATLDGASIKDGFVHVGSLKVQVIETLLRCPAEGCFKNFRNTMLLKMHIKHYHRELRKMMGVTPKVLDLAYARTRPSDAEMKREAQQRIIKVKLPRLHKRVEEPIPEPPKEVKMEPAPVLPPSTPPIPEETVPKPQDSPKLRSALVNKPAKRPKVLLPVRNPDPEPVARDDDAASDPLPFIKQETVENEVIVEPKQEIPDCGLLDFETAISTHTVTRVNGVKTERRRKRFAAIAKAASEEEWGEDSPDSRSTSCGSPDSKPDDADLLLRALSSPSTDAAANDYMFTENGERIKLVHMKREEIINCHCGFREEDGLMVQCELCLCWQHALCHNIQREAEVPEKYTCSICLNPRRGRRRQRFTHDQDRLYEGLLPSGGGGRSSEPLRRAHELAGNLLLAADALHAVRVNTHVASKRNHPKLYLWAKDWESLELSFAQEKLNSEYSDLNVIINNLGKENMPIKSEDKKERPLDIKASGGEREDRNGQHENEIGSQTLLGGLLSSPGGVSLADIPINVSDVEKIAKTVTERAAPTPEAAIENGACRARLLRHAQRCHALLDQRLDSIEAQVAELESQDPSLEDDESADFCPRTKQTMLMIARDLDTMEELGILT